MNKTYLNNLDIIITNKYIYGWYLDLQSKIASKRTTGCRPLIYNTLYLQIGIVDVTLKIKLVPSILSKCSYNIITWIQFNIPLHDVRGNLHCTKIIIIIDDKTIKQNKQNYCTCIENCEARLIIVDTVKPLNSGHSLSPKCCPLFESVHYSEGYTFFLYRCWSQNEQCFY